MSKQPLDPLLDYQATSMELVALGSAILLYFRYVDYGKQVSEEERIMAKHLQSFHNRLIAQLRERGKEP